MSDTMSAVEIEDVLSSIRRLVSEDLRPTHRLVSAALRNGASKLILTPALRVVADVGTALPDPESNEDGRHDLQSVLRETEAEDDGPPPETALVFGSVRVQDPQGLPDQSAPPEADINFSDANFLATAMSRINGLATVGGSDAGPLQSDTIEAVVAVVGAAVGPDEWELDGGEPAPQAKAWSDSVWDSDLAAPAKPQDAPAFAALTDAAAADPASDLGFAAQVPQDDPRTNAADLVAEPVLILAQAANTDAEPEQGSYGGKVAMNADAASADAITADSVTAEAESSDAVTAEADSAEAVTADTESASVEANELNHPEAEAAADDADDGSGFMSEELLRAIVGDMIREELQGALGERITRNVRKLVRAEINRALASRDFDEVAGRG